MNKIKRFDEFKPTNRFVGPNGEFKPTNTPEEGTTSIQYLEELLEWLYYHDNISNDEKLKLITELENQIQSLLNNGQFMINKINYKPTWSVKLKNDLDER